MKKEKTGCYVLESKTHDGVWRFHAALRGASIGDAHWSARIYLQRVLHQLGAFWLNKEGQLDASRWRIRRYLCQPAITVPNLLMRQEDMPTQAVKLPGQRAPV